MQKSAHLFSKNRKFDRISFRPKSTADMTTVNVPGFSDKFQILLHLKEPIQFIRYCISKNNRYQVYDYHLSDKTRVLVLIDHDVTDIIRIDTLEFLTTAKGFMHAVVVSVIGKIRSQFYNVHETQRLIFAFLLRHGPEFVG